MIWRPLLSSLGLQQALNLSANLQFAPRLALVHTLAALLRNHGRHGQCEYEEGSHRLFPARAQILQVSQVAHTHKPLYPYHNVAQQSCVPILLPQSTERLPRKLSSAIASCKQQGTTFYAGSLETLIRETPRTQGQRAIYCWLFPPANARAIKVLMPMANILSPASAASPRSCNAHAKPCTAPLLSISTLRHTGKLERPSTHPLRAEPPFNCRF